MSEKISRRDFLRKSAVGLAGLTIVPSAVLGKAAGQTAPSDKLNIAAVGIGGMGAANLKNMETENIVALCDVDWKYAKGTFDRYPNAKRYWDYRKMLDEMGKSIDAVLVATADHTHCMIAADAMTLGKHVYVQKPLTHSVYESRLLTKLAKKYNVATQMGNQGASGEGVRQVCDWIWNGEIGEVTRVDTFTDRPIRWIGTCSSARLRCAHTTRSIIRGTGVDGGISVPVLWVIWPATSSIRYSKVCN